MRETNNFLSKNRILNLSARLIVRINIEELFRTIIFLDLFVYKKEHFGKVKNKSEMYEILKHTLIMRKTQSMEIFTK